MNYVCSKQVLLVIVLLWLGGCTMLGPDFHAPPAPVQEKWSGEQSPLFKKASPQEAMQWWKLFNDPVLDRLINTAFEQNLSLQAAGLRIMEARAQLGFSKGNLFPQVQEMTGSVATVGTTAPASDRYFNAASVGFDAAWELDFWGKYRRGVESSDAALQSSVADYDDMLVSLSAEVARTYVNIRTLQERIRIAEKNGEIQKNSLRLVELQYESGTVTELDVMQAKTLLTNTLAAIPRMRSSLAAYRHALAVLLGTVPENIDSYLEPQATIPELSAEIAIGVPAELLRRRPDIRRAEMQAAAQCARIGIARAALFPSFTLLGTLGWSATDMGPQSLGNIFDADSFSYSFGPAFRWNIFNYGRLKNQVRVQDARFQQTLAAYRNTVLNAAREVEDAMRGLEFAKKEAELLRQGVESSKRSMHLSMLQYQEGFVDYQRVLDSTRAVTQNQDQYAQAKGNIATYIIALYKALGGGWQVRNGRPFVPEEIKKEMEGRTDWGDLLQEK
jgi:NodT family efflux transporter outer membrane factor (OMF) lipoprotein